MAQHSHSDDAQVATDLANVFGTNRTHSGNLNLDRLAAITESVREFAAEYGDSLGPLNMWDLNDDARQLAARGSRTFITRTDSPEDGEVVHVSPKGPNDDGEEVVRVVYPERDSLDSDMNTALYSYETTALNLLRTMDNDGGWYEVRPFETVEETVNCPECGAFVSVTEDVHGLPGAECSRVSCNGFLDDRDLVDSGAVMNVY